jgi:hypothetical protein
MQVTPGTQGLSPRAAKFAKGLAYKVDWFVKVRR